MTDQVQQRQGDQWVARPSTTPPPAGLDPSTWTASGRLGEALKDLQQRLTAVEGELVALRSEVADLRAQGG